VLVGLLLVAAFSRRTGLLGILALVVLSALWFVVDAPIEGPTLVRVSQGHGFTAADIIGVAGLLLAAWRLLQWGRLRVERRNASARG
jgi:hypothetical protein